MKYELHSDLSHINSINQGHLNKAILKLARMYMKNVYKVMNKIEGISYETIIKDYFKLYVIIPDGIDDNNRSVIVNYHGGAFVYKGWKNHFELACEYAKRCKSILVYCDYQLAMDCNDTLSDCISAYKWVIDNKDKYKIDLNKIVLAGDSAGGYLSLEVNDYINHNNLPKPLGLMLVYPVTDTNNSTDSMKKYTDTPVWNSILNKEMWDIYNKDKTHKSYLEEDVSYIKNCYIETAEYDCLHDDGVLLYERIKNNGDVVLNETHKTCHGYDTIITVPIVLDAIKARCDFINKILSK